MVIDFSKLDCGQRPTLVLRSMDGRAIQTLGYAFGVSLNAQYNETSELSFAYPAHLDGQRVPGYGKIKGMQIVDMVGIGQFVITGNGIEESASKELKTIKAYSLEYEFTFKKLTLANSTYNFWNPVEPENTILSIILEKMPSWSIGSIDESLIGKYRTFECNNTNLFNFMKGTLQESYSCIFDFDTYNRKINVRDVSSRVQAQPVYVSLHNLAKEITIEEQAEDIFTCLDVNGADGVTIRNVNPLGTNKIYDLTYFMNTDNFSPEIVDKWNNWKQGFESRQQEYFNLTVENALLHVQLETERAALTSLKGELKVLEQHQAVAVEAAAQGSTANLGSYNAEITSKNSEITSKEAFIKELETTLGNSQNSLIAINQACSWSAYGITPEEQKLIDRYIKEDAIEDSSFVSPVVDSFTASGDSYPNSNCSITISGSNITGATLTSGKVVYSARKGKAVITVNGEEKLSGTIIQGAFDAMNGDGVASFYLETGCVTVSGPFTFGTDCVPDPEIGGNYIEGTSGSINSQKANLYITKQVTAYSQRAVEWDLFEYGKEVLARMAEPSYTFSVDSGNFLSMDEFEAFRRELKLGDRLYLDLASDFGVLQPVLLGVEIDFDSRDLKLEFGDSFRLSDSAFKLADLLEQSISMGKSVDLSKYTSQEFHNAGGTNGVQELFDAVLDMANNSLFSSGNQAYIIDDAGIRLRKWTDDTHTAYEDTQIWMTNTSMVFTKDNWNSASMAIGTFTDPEMGELTGVVAPSIVGKLLAGTSLVIESSKQDNGVSVFRVDANGAKLYNSQFDLVNEYVTNGVSRVGQISLHPSIGLVSGALKAENEFYAYDSDGNIVGIKATDGTSIDSVSDIGDKTPMANLWCDNEGNIYLKGNVYATDGVFNGTVYATDGKFEGIVQASDYQDPSGKSMLTNGKFGAEYLDLKGITIRNDNGDVTFSVDSDGHVQIGAGAIDDLDKYALKTELPTSTSDLKNDSGFASYSDVTTYIANQGYQTASGVVSIINGTVTADFVNALGVTALYLQGNIVEVRNPYTYQSYGALYPGTDPKDAVALTLKGNTGLRLASESKSSGVYLEAGSSGFISLDNGCCNIGAKWLGNAGQAWGYDLPAGQYGQIFFKIK